MSRIEQNMVAENIADITSGIHGLAERVAYRYAAIERRHRFRFLFDPLRTRVASLDNQMVLLSGVGLILSFALLEILV